MARPVERLEVGSFDAFAIYRAAQRLDPWEGESYSGTSVLAGAQAAQDMGILDGYYWAFDINAIAVGISRKGPAVLGLPWYESMFDPDDTGYLRVGGDIVGGHCVAAVGVSVTRRDITIVNSWGPGWGGRGGCGPGRARIGWDDLADLLADDGEALFPARRLKAVS